MGFLIQSSIPGFYFYNYNIYILCMHNIYLYYTIKQNTNSTPGGSITDSEKEYQKLYHLVPYRL